MDGLLNQNPVLLSALGINPEDLRRQQQQAGLLSAGLQLLAGSGYSPIRQSTGQLLGQAGMAGVQGMQQAGESAIDRALKGMQVQKMTLDLETARRQQAALQRLRETQTGNVQQALAGGGGPTIQNAERLATTAPAGGITRDQLIDFARNPDLPTEERNILLKVAEQLKTPEVSLPANAALYAQTMGYGTDPRKFSPAQARDVQSFIERPTIDQQVSLARLGFETGINLPATRGVQPTAQISGQAPAQTPGQAPVQPSVAANVNPVAGLSPKASQEIRAKMIEARPAVLSSANYTLTQIKDTFDTADKLLNDPEALKAISGFTGPISALVPGTKAYDAAALINNLQSRNFVSEIQTMRQNSPTGGAVGNVAVAEMQGLSNIPASLQIGQSEKQLRDQLEQLKRRSNAAITSIIDSYKRDYGSTDGLEKIGERAVVETKPVITPPQGAVDLLKRNPRLAKEFDDKYGEGMSAKYLKVK
jgi:hypothetical protein